MISGNGGRLARSSSACSRKSGWGDRVVAPGPAASLQEGVVRLADLYLPLQPKGLGPVNEEVVGGHARGSNGMPP